MVKTIIKRDGRTAEFHPEKIADAVEKSFQACAAMQGRDTAEKIAATVVEKLESGAIEGTPTVEGVQDLVEETLIESGFVQTAKAYILYRAERSRVRDVNSRLIQTLKDITFSKAADSDMKRENANIDADTAMGTMLKYGSESAKQFYEMCVIDPRYAKAHREGDIHIHDMDFYTLTTTCCQIELRKLFKGGFSTGHGVLREPTTSPATPRLPASPSSRTRTISMAVSRCATSITAWPWVWARRTAACSRSTWPRPSTC